MVRKLLLFVGVIAFSCCCFAQTLTRLEGDDAVTLSYLSRNGKFAYGVIEAGCYMYDLTEKKMLFFENSSVSDVSNDGTYVGSYKVTSEEGIVLQEIPAYFRNGEAFYLPLPTGDTKFVEGAARAVNKDESLMAGYVAWKGGSDRIPCIWTLQPDKTYDLQLLPTAELDFTGRKPQAVDALLCSETGDKIVGRMVDWTGTLNLIYTWTRNDADTWEMKEFGKDILFKEGAEIPTIPDPIAPDPMAYYTAQDSINYNQALEDYLAGRTDDNPEWYKQNYITNPDSAANYNAAAQEYNGIMDIAIQKTQELYDCMTYTTIDVYGMVMSSNGKYAGTVTIKFDQGGGGEPLSLNAKSNGTSISPSRLDLETGLWDIKDYIDDGLACGVTNEGNLVFATPYTEFTRTSFIIPNGTDDIIDIAKWVEQETVGEIDMKPDFTFNYEYDDPWTGEHVTVTDSLIVGTVSLSSDGRVILGTFRSPVEAVYVTYYVDLDNRLSGTNPATTETVISVSPNPVADILNINSNEDVEVNIYNLQGSRLLNTNEKRINMSDYPTGLYVIEINGIKTKLLKK